VVREPGSGWTGDVVCRSVHRVVAGGGSSSGGWSAESIEGTMGLPFRGEPVLLTGVRREAS
jgi:hypothetical protein